MSAKAIPNNQSTRSIMNHRTIASCKIRDLVFAIMVVTCAVISAQESGTPIPQPKVADLQVSDANKRVDLVLPTFSNPTKVTNPLFPVSKQASFCQDSKNETLLDAMSPF